MRSSAKFAAPRLLLLALTASGLVASAQQLPSAFDSPAVSGWVLADLNGDQKVDLATAQTGSHDARGYAQEVRITLGAFEQTSFHFLSRGATVQLSSQDVDGDDDGDLVVFEPLSSQPIGVWINDGAGSFHEGNLADFKKLWSEHPGPAWRANVQQPALAAISEERIQPLAPPAAAAAPELVSPNRISQNPPSQQDALGSDFRPRAPPRNS